MAIEKVLLVDDNQDLRKLVAKTLTATAKWQVVTAASGVEALTLLESDMPDLILMDVSMPQMDGIVTIGKIRAQEKLTTIPIILITARVQNHEMSEYKKLAIAGVISKPFDPVILSTQIKKLVEQWQTAATQSDVISDGP